MPESETVEDAVRLVRRIREMRGLTQEGLARELGVSFATVNGWENGRHRPIPLLEKKLQELAGDQSATTVPDREVAVPDVTLDRSADELAAQSGWPFHGREKRDLYHRPREFPGDVQKWRTEMVQRGIEDDGLFPLSSRRAKEDPDNATENVRALVDD